LTAKKYYIEELWIKACSFFSLLCWMGIHYGIYKSSTTSVISYLNSPLHHSPLSYLPPFLEYFQQVSSSIYIHVYTVFATYSLIHIFSSLPPSSQWYQEHVPRQDLLCQFCEKKKWYFCFLKIATQGVLCGTSICICIIVWFGSSPLFFFLLPQSLSYGGFKRFKNFIFILLQKVYQPH
jgi:hypothetical protein